MRVNKAIASYGTIIFALLVASAPPAASAQAPNAMNREEAIAVIREMRRIVTPQGVDRSETIRIGGINQFVNIRGRDRRNPILLVLHGGPGFPETPLAWWNTRDLEEYFTVVHWDQRGSGRTFLINDAAAVAPTMQPERFIADTQELVGWLRNEFSKDKIFLLGHSWGASSGLSLLDGTRNGFTPTSASAKPPTRRRASGGAMPLH